MSRRMLINGRYAEELRMAIIEDSTLESYKVEIEEGGVARGNIYRGVVANVESSLDAAFIDYGEEKHGFLTRHDVVPQAYHHSGPSGEESPRIEQVLEKGRPILVQVTKDAVGNKGAALTTNISLAGRYLVLMPFDDSHGMSRKVEDETERKKLRDKVQSLMADGYGFIVRTNAVNQTKTALKADLDELVRLWKQILAESTEGKGPRLLRNDQDLVLQALRDHLDSSIEEILVDDEVLLAKAQAYLTANLPKSKVALTLYRERVPLFSRFNLEPQVASVYKRVLPLPSGGSIVIDPTEALTAIDVNSGKATAGSSQDETAYNTNLEAAAEVARQLRLRDIGGLVVVDFIDMRSPGHRRAVERALKEAMKRDKARSHLGRISSNGLLEINRQRIQQALQLRTHRLCPSCQGMGRHLSPDLTGLHLLRRIEAAAATGRLSRARIALNPQVADAVQNRRRGQLAALEKELKIHVEIVSAPELPISEERVQWFERESAEQAAGRESREELILRAGEPAPSGPRRDDRGDRAGRGRDRAAERRKEREARRKEQEARRKERSARRKERPAKGSAVPAEGPGRATESVAPSVAGGAELEVSAVEAEIEVEPGAEGEHEAPEAAESEAGGSPDRAESNGRRRRRRRRRPGAPAEQAPSGAPSVPPASARSTAPVPAEPAGGAAPRPSSGEGGGSEADSRARKRRRRRGGRRRGGQRANGSESPPPQNEG